MSSYPATHSTSEEDSGMKLLKIQSGSLAPDVPQEIVDLIIDNLQDDPLALRACSLTSHQWLHRSRRHLHARVRIGEYYINLKRYSRPQVAQYVRELDVYMVRTMRGRQRTTTDRLWEMMKRFSGLTWLVLRDYEFYRLSPARADILHNICTGLRTLELHHVHFADPADFLTLVGRCGHLSTLSLEDGQFYEPISQAQAEEQCRNILNRMRLAGDALPGSGLRSLKIGSLSSSPEFEKVVNVWVAELTRLRLLKELALSKEGADSCAGALQAVGSSPIDLRISRCNPGSEKPIQTGIEYCTRIRSLSFITSLVLPPRSSEQSWIVPFLQQLPSPSQSLARTPPPLRTLKFELHWSDKDCVDIDFLTEIDHILSTRQDTFGGLEEIVFTIQRHLSPKLKVFRPTDADTDTFAEAHHNIPEWTMQFKLFLKTCLGTHLKGVAAKQSCVVKLVFPNDGDMLRVEARRAGEECQH